MPFTITEARLGYLPIDQIDTGVTNVNASSVSPTPPMTLGQVVRAFDPTLGEGEVILLVGVASTVVGSLVTYNATTFQTALSPNTAGFAAPVAVAMSANLAGTFGWYQIGGQATIKKTAVAVSPQVSVFQSATAGRIFATATTGRQIVNAKSANLATIASGTSTVIVMIDRPHMQGQII